MKFKFMIKLVINSRMSITKNLLLGKKYYGELILTPSSNVKLKEMNHGMQSTLNVVSFLKYTICFTRKGGDGIYFTGVS